MANTSLPETRSIKQTLAAAARSVANAADRFTSQFLGDQNITENVDAATAARSLVRAKAGEFDVVNVIADYDWTLSHNKTLLQSQIPFIRLTEFKLTASNVINSLQSTLMAYSDIAAANNQALNALPDIGAKLGGVASTIAASTLESISPQSSDSVNAIFSDLKNTIDGKLGNFLGSGKSSIQSVAASVGNAVTNYTKSAASVDKNFGEGSGSLVDLYGGLYTRKSTGREYTIPYFTEDYVSIDNGFEESYNGFAGKISDTINSMVEGATTMPSLTEPGVYVQRPKFYNFKSSGASISFTFCLFNTITPMAYMKNNELIQKLALNNMPRRFSRVVVEPPCIYEVLIPGRAFYPYCFVERMEVKHMGTKRVLDREIIPEAYQVNITLRSLTTDVSNFYDTQMTRHGMEFTQSTAELPPQDSERPVVKAEAIQREVVRAVPVNSSGGSGHDFDFSEDFNLEAPTAIPSSPSRASLLNRPAAPTTIPSSPSRASLLNRPAAGGS